MLNDSIPTSELRRSLEEFLDPLDILLDEFLPTKRQLLFKPRLLGKIHHAVNVSNYAKYDFRYRLLRRASDESLIKYFRQIGLRHSDIADVEKRLTLIKRASRLPWKNDTNTKAFLKVFGYEESLIPTKDETPPDQEMVNIDSDPLRTLYDYQAEVFFKAMNLAEYRNSRFIIQMPTGSGKTRTSMEIISHFLNNSERASKRQVLWIAETEELCEQAISSFKHVWHHTGRSNAKIYRMFGKSRIEKFERGSLIVASYKKLLSGIRSGKKIPQPDLIVCDEAHSAIAPKYRHVIEKAHDDGTRIIGLTATPIRGVQSEENQELTDFFNNKLIDIETDENAIVNLQKKGYLAYYIPKTIDTNATFKLSKDAFRLLSLERDLPPSFLNEIAKNNHRNLIIAKVLYELAQRKIKVLYFAPSVFQSKLICALLIALGFAAAHIDGQTPQSYRRDVIDKFRAGEIKILCNFDIFTAGFDDPDIDAVVIGRPTTSIILHQQMIGRGMRGPKMGGQETFELYRIRDTLPDIEVADQYFTDVWR